MPFSFINREMLACKSIIITLIPYCFTEANIQTVLQKHNMI